ncbi:hypothetical protein [Puia dinghuensis]|uniref:Uncharacterized protein n=1 Tax=Puia dinghuensis TaxID=1792502 RepID=A0A8J2UE02_9BACT|nr:hypothetical protein [Puia dinghuensis]GGB04897.1 hypothetical protein GCM10011511_30270 [Puia dinghuensis]
MKTTLRFASILSWFNIIVWGFFAALMLLGSLAVGYIPLMIFAVLFCAIPLNCYAALQLHKSIRRPNIKLSSQTPVGIRFVGFVALFFGIMTITNSIGNIRNPKEMLELSKEAFSQVKWLNMSTATVSSMRTGGIIGLLLGLAVIVNVVLNLRLLRWYYLVHQSDAS